MNHALIRTSGLILAAMFAFATLPVGAATTATGPYYANPSWDQQLPASTRFIVLSNWVDTAHPSGGAAVLDRETGLIWEQSPDATPHVVLPHVILLPAASPSMLLVTSLMRRWTACRRHILTRS